MSLGPLLEGTYTVALVGESFTYLDTFNIPTSTPDSVYEFQITVVSRETGETVPGVPLSLRLSSPADTTLRDTTDSSGFALLAWFSSIPDSLQYELRRDPYRQRFGKAWAKLGTPEVMKVGINE